MRKNLMRACIVFGTIVAAATAARATIIADFTDDFSYPSPASGWSYLWNANGPIGNSANYALLVPDAPGSGRYETIDDAPDSFPDAAPGSSTSVTSTTLTPGQGSGQNPFERYVLAAYTFSAEEIAANGDQVVLDLYSFGVPAGSQDGVSTKLYKNNTLLVDQPLPPNFTFDYQTPAPNGGPIGLGQFAAGDTLYVAIGANGLALPGGGNDTGDVLTVDYSIALVPEPASAAAMSLAASLMLSRRRRSASR